MKRLMILAALALTACEEEPIDGRQVYQEDCAICHGPDGRGDGELAAQLSRKPTDLTTIASRRGGFDRDWVMTTIDGLHRPEAFSESMPEFGAGDMGDIVMVGATPIPERLLAVAIYLESIQE